MMYFNLDVEVSKVAIHFIQEHRSNTRNHEKAALGLREGNHDLWKTGWETWALKFKFRSHHLHLCDHTVSLNLSEPHFSL